MTLNYNWSLYFIVGSFKNIIDHFRIVSNRVNVISEYFKTIKNEYFKAVIVRL